MKYFLICLTFLCVFACKSTINDEVLIQPKGVLKSSLRLFGPDGKKILSGSGTIQKKWEVLRLYHATEGDQSTISDSNIGLVNSTTQKDLLNNLPGDLKNANIIFETSAVGINGYGGISDGSFKVIIPSGLYFLNQVGSFSVQNGITPFYETNYGVFINNKKVVPIFYLENTKMTIGNKELKGDFLQLISPDSEKVLSFPVTVALLFSPT